MSKQTVITGGTIWWVDSNGDRHQFLSVEAMLAHVGRCGGYYKCGTTDELRLTDQDTGKINRIKLVGGLLVIEEVTNP